MTGPVHPDWDRIGADWPNRDASHFTEAGGIRWHYQRMGAGPVMVLLHGAGAATHSWRDLMPLLAQDFDVIAPDLPGHGFTRIQNRRQCALPAMAGGVGSLLNHLGAVPDLLVGHSAGAAIALQMVTADLLSPRVVVGLNAALAPFRGVAGVLFPPLAKALALNPFVPWMFSSLAKSTGQVRKLIGGTGSDIDARGMDCYTRMITRSDHVDGALSMMALWDLEPLLTALPQISIPVRLIVGAGDKMVPPNEAQALGAKIPQITVESVPGLGHLMHEEAPDRFAGIIRDIARALDIP